MPISSTSFDLDSKKKYLESKISELKTRAQKLYNRIIEDKTENKNSFSTQIDELATIIKDIIYYTEIIDYFTKPYNEEFTHRLSPEERAAMNHQNLTAKKDTVQRTVDMYEKAINDLKTDSIFYHLVTKLELAKVKATIDLDNLNSELRPYEELPDLTDNEIDIYLTENPITVAFKGRIFLHNTAIEIGNIEYRGSIDNPWIGDIGYSINTPYQGHNYAYKALQLIKSKIIDSGINSVVITTHNDNIASQKTIEKFGGKRISSNLEHIFRYECNLLEFVNQNNNLKQ